MCDHLSFVIIKTSYTYTCQREIEQKLAIDNALALFIACSCVFTLYVYQVI